MADSQLGRGLAAAVTSPLAKAAAYLALITRANPRGSAAALLARPDVTATLREALSEGHEAAMTYIEQGWLGTGADPEDPRYARLQADADRIFGALDQLRDRISAAHASVPPRGFIPGADAPGSNPGRDAAERRAEAVAAAVTGWGRQASQRARMALSAAQGLGRTAAAIETATLHSAAGEQVRKRWHRNPASASCLWCRRLDGVTIGLGESFAPYLGGPAVLPGASARRVATEAGAAKYNLPVGAAIVYTQPPRLYHGDLQGPVLHPYCCLPGTRVMPGDEEHRLALPVPAPGLGADGGAPAAAAVAESVGDLSRAGVRAVTERDYVGEVIVIRTARGYELSVTPNHPVATRGGWVAAAQLQAGDHVLSSTEAEWHPAGDGPDVEHVPPAIEEVAKAFSVVLGAVPGSAEDFHGDGTEGEISIVRTDRRLVADLEAQLTDHGSEVKFSLCDVPGVGTAALVRGGLAEEDAVGLACAAHSLMGSSGVPLAFFRGQPAVPLALSLAPSPDSRSGFEEPAADDAPADVEGFCERLLALSSRVALDEVVEVKRYVSAHTRVYNLSTSTGWYFAEGIVTHNCECWLQIVRNPGGGAVPSGSGQDDQELAGEPPAPQVGGFLAASDVRAMTEDQYQAGLALLRAAVHGMDQAMRGLAEGR